MKERGKALETYSINNHTDHFSYSTLEYMPCKKHPSSSSAGICAYCLKEKLSTLVCSECGEQRLSSCSCSDVSSYRNSCGTGEVGSVGRISSFIENEKTDANPKNKDDNKSGEVILLRRSSSSCVEIKRNKNGFWKIKRLFRKKREKGSGKDDVWGVSDVVKGVSRSRSLCSFRNGGGGGGGLNDGDEGSDYAFSSAKISDVTGGILFDYSDHKTYGLFNEFDHPRKSGFRGLSDAESDHQPRKSTGFRVSNADNEPRKSGFRGLSSDAENDHQPRRSSGFRGLSSDAENDQPRRSSGFRVSNAETEPRKSGFRGSNIAEIRGLLDSENGNNFRHVKKGVPIELNRVNSVPNRSVFPAKESDFSAMDESAFIDLKLDLSSESKREFSLARISAASDHDGRLRGEVHEYGASMANLKTVNGLSSSGGSCRVTVNEKEFKSGSKSHKIWKWIFRQNLGKSASKKDENNIFKS